jgi:hypothetical protein
VPWSAHESPEPSLLVQDRNVGMLVTLQGNA